MKKLLFIYNPLAGRQKARQHLSSMLEVFAARNYLVTAYPTKSRGDATYAAANLAPDYDRVVCCGGDGTLNETISGLMQLPPEQRPVLGYIPTGTTNDFSRNLSFPRGTDKVAAVACGGIPRACDLGLANGKWFTYVAAFGLFTDVTYTTPQNTKNLLGHTAYVLEGASRLASLKSYWLTVEADGVVIEGEFIYGMVGNTVSVGGLLSLPSDLVKLDDGLFEVVLVRKPRNATDLQTIFRALTTQIMPDGEGPIVALRASHLSFTCPEPLPWTLDGEFGGEHTTTEIENLPRAVVIACGK